MSLTTVNVLCRASDQLGNPIAGAVITAKLSGPDVDATDGYVLPEIISGVADANGLLTLALWPNALGSTETYYDIKITNPDTGKKISLTATVPNVACELHLIAGLPPYDGKSDGQLAIDAAVAAVAPAIAAKLSAEAALAATVIQAGTATAQAVISTAQASASSASAAAALSSQNSAAGSANTATAQAGIATTQAGNATASAAAALVSQDAAAVSANTATSQAGIATTQAAAAVLSAGTAGTQAGVATAQAVIATAQAGIATADVVLTHADVVLTNADVALTHADVNLTHADVVTTHADVALTNADVVLTHADVVTTHADVVLTHADVVLTHADVVITNADAATSTTQAGIATTQAGLAAADVALTHADVVLTHADVTATNQSVADATTQAGLATTNGAAQVALATTQAGISTTQAGIATTQAGISSASAQTAANGVLAQLTALKTQTETARDEAIAGLGAADQSQNLVVLSAGIQIALDLIKQSMDFTTITVAAAGVTAETTRAVDLTLLSSGIQAALDMIGVVARQVSGGTVQLAGGSAAEPSLWPAADRNTGVYFPAADALALVTAGLERLRVDASGNLGIGTNAPSGLLDVNDNRLRVRTAKTPATAAAAGNAGEICWDASFIYVATATNTWKRSALTTW